MARASQLLLRCLAALLGLPVGRQLGGFWAPRRLQPTFATPAPNTTSTGRRLLQVGGVLLTLPVQLMDALQPEKESTQPKKPKQDAGRGARHMRGDHKLGLHGTTIDLEKKMRCPP